MAMPPPVPAIHRCVCYPGTGGNPGGFRNFCSEREGVCVASGMGIKRTFPGRSYPKKVTRRRESGWGLSG